jgi:hypothetical protein
MLLLLFAPWQGSPHYCQGEQPPLPPPLLIAP